LSSCNGVIGRYPKNYYAYKHKLWAMKQVGGIVEGEKIIFKFGLFVISQTLNSYTMYPESLNSTQLNGPAHLLFFDPPLISFQFQIANALPMTI